MSEIRYKEFCRKNNMGKIRYKEFYETVAEGCRGLDEMLNEWLDDNPNVIVKDIKFNFSMSENYLPIAIALVAYVVVRNEEEVDPNSSAMQYPFD